MSKAAERLRTLSPERLALLEKMRQQERAAAARPAPEAPPETPRFSLISAADRALLPDDVEDAYPLTNMQAGMLYHMELSPDYLIYQDVESKRLPGRIDFELFHRAVAKVVARHDLLRTGLERTRYGEPLQLVHARAEMPIAVEDLRSLPASEQDAAIAAYAREEKRRAFEYAKPPLLRLMFHLLEDDRFQLTVTMCHPIMDGWSLNTCWLEISAHYAALVEGRDLPVEPPPPVAYRDFVALERQATASPATRAFWDQVLAGSPGLELPRWPAPFRERGGIPVTTRKIAIPGGDFLAAKAMTQRAGLSIKSALLAVHAKVLSTLTGLDDVLAGLTTHGRPERTGGDRILGLFFNTVPIRLRLDPGSWLDLSRRAFEAEQALMPHRRYPLGLLQQKWGRRTLLETSFNMTHFHHTKGSAPRPAARDEALGNIDLEENDFLLSTTFTIDPSDDSLSLVFACHRSAICREQFELLLGWYRRALAALGSDPGAPHEAFSPLSPPERQQALLEWNDTSAREEPLTLDQLFFARAAETPGAIAVAFEGEEVTYLSLAERAERLARRLQAEGVGPEVRVAIALERSVEMLVALLGVLRAGGAYVPLDPAYPRDRIAYVLGDAGAALLLAEAPLRQRLPELDGIKALTSAEWRDEPAAPASPTGGARPRPDNLAYVLYTSGSTGRPKGVEVTHRGVVNFLAAMQELLRLGPDDRLLAVTTLSFDIAGLELYLPLATGGRVEIASRATAADGVRLARALRETDATAMQATPATWAMLLESGWRGDRGLLMLCGGEALPRPLAERLLPCGRALWNLYGPTETTIWSAARRVTLGEGAVPIGRPIANNQLVVLDSKLQPAPIATPGELMIGGSGLARGYHGRPDLTAERFVPSPAATAEPGARLYRTGDLARLAPDGEIEFLGRADHQIKVRGFRIELGEIEACLLAHPALGQAVVAARDDGSGTRLVAYVVARSEPPPARELRAFLLEKLPDYMVPALFVPLPELPLTPNGKVDRKALPVPEADRAALAASYVAPRTETEARAAALWAELLGLPRVGIEDPFFELGGHSLLAMQLVLKLREAFAVDLPLQSLFEQPTVAGLAAEIDRRRGEAAASFPALALPELVPDPASAGEPFPLTDLQQAYWIGSGGALELGNVSAHTYQELAFPDLDPERLGRAWARVVARHAALRTVILPDGRQRVLSEAPAAAIPFLDLSDREPDEAEAELLAVRRRMCEEGPDLSGWPLFEIRLTRLPSGCRLHVSLSLLISDAVSFGLLAGDLARLYTDPAAEPPPLAASYRDYVLACERLRGTDLHARHLAYWRERLTDLPPGPELPLAKPPSALQRSHLTRLDGTLPAGIWTRVKTEARRSGVTATVLVAAVFAEVLATWSRHRRFCLNLLAQRRLPLHPDVPRIAGNFGAPLLLEIDLTVEEGVAERLRRLQARLFRDLDHGLVSGIEVLRELARRQGESGGGAFTSVPVVLASTLDLGAGSAAGAGSGRMPVHTHLQTPQVWIDHQVFEVDGALAFHWYHVAELFPAGMIEAMFRAFGERLAALAEASLWREPARALTPAADLRLFAAANATAEPEPEKLLHEPFFARAAEAPEALAIVCGEARVRYGELAGLAEALALALRARHVVPNELVAVVMEKGWEQAAAVLAIERAGAAYLPIDPELPDERIRYLLASTGTRIALVQARIEGAIDWPAGIERIPVVACPGVSGAGEHAATRSAVALGPIQDRSDLAYVIFTSGSTGLPKGVMIDHRGAANTVADVNRRFAVGPGDRVLALSALSFDLSVYDLFGLLGAGGTVVMPEPRELREPARWEAILRRERATIWSSVPALLEMLADDLEARGERLPEDLRLVLLSGDWIPVSLPDRLRRLGRPGLEVVGMGGATEASIWSILYPIGAVDPGWASIPYGRPMANQTFAVLDDALDPRPVWVPGQLHIGGIGLAQGYFRDAEKTAASFFVHPRTGERLYRTGDLGRYLPDGTIEFLGREDQQVKIQGYRIELGEIEAALAGHPGVRSAVVAALGEKRGAKRLVAYVVPSGAEPPAAEELREALAAKIPRYMIPARFVPIESIPLSSNGKVDRKALPDPDASRTAGEHVPPRDELEHRLAAIWEELLGLGPVSVAASFFELGGHSLIAVRLMARIKAAFGRELPLATLFEAPTIERLADILRAGTSESPAASRQPLVPIRGAGAGRPFFCVHPVGGNVLGYVDLARALGDDRPFYGLQSPDGAEPATLPEIAALYLAAIRAVQPEGPYLLGGWSMGGAVAYEMARQLEAAGEEAALVAMIDVAAPIYPTDGPVDDATLASWFAFDLAAQAGSRLAVPAGELRGLDDTARAARLHALAVAAGALAEEVPEDELARLFALFRRNFRALLDYRPEPFAGGLTLFPALERKDDPSPAWRALAGGGVEVHPIPGDHYTILRPPHLEVLAERLRSCLDSSGAAASARTAIRPA